MKFYDVIKVVHVPIEDADKDEKTHHNPEIRTSLIDFLAFIGHLPLKDQIFLLTNTLTVSGFTQKEISQALDIPYQTYRNRLLEVRKDFKDKLTAHL